MPFRSVLRTQITTASVEQTVPLPKNTVRIKARPIRNPSATVSFSTEVGGSDGGFIGTEDNPWDSGDVSFLNPTNLYFQSQQAGVIVEIEALFEH